VQWWQVFLRAWFLVPAFRIGKESPSASSPHAVQVRASTVRVPAEKGEYGPLDGSLVIRPLSLKQKASPLLGGEQRGLA
jgi:hypothetical protein